MLRPASLTAVLVVSVMASSFSLAQQKTGEPSDIAAAKEMFVAMGADAQFDTVIGTMTRGLAGIFKQQHPSHAHEIDQVMELMATKFIARKSELVDMVAPLYAEKLTAEEMTEVARFFRSPIGQKLVKNQPEIMQKSMVLGMSWGQRLGQEVEQEARKEFRKRGLPL